MKIIFFGTPQEVVPVLETLTEQFAIVAVVTTSDQKSGRKQTLTSTPVKVFAKDKTIPVITPPQFTDEILKQLQNFKPDLYVVTAYGKIIPNDILHIPKYGAINIHPSLLPHYRGPTPLQTTILNGDKRSGLTFMKVDERMDHGPILHQMPFTLENTDTFGWLMQSKFALAAQILPHVIEEYVSGKLIPQPQDESLASYTKMIDKQDGYIDMNNPPQKEQLDRMIRAYYPWPTVWTKTKINNREMTIKFLPKQKLQVEGKKPVAIKDFLNGYPEMKEKLEKIFT